MFQKISYYFKVLSVSLVLISSFSTLKAQENATKNDSAISRVMFSVNALTSIVGEYGGNTIVSLGNKSQVLLSLNLIRSEIQFVDNSLNSVQIIETIFNQGFSVAPEYRWVFKRSNTKNWISSYFLGAYFMYQQVYETREKSSHRNQSQGPDASQYYMESIVKYSGSSIGLTLGVNLYSNSNLFLSVWTGRGIIIRDKMDILFDRGIYDIGGLASGRDLGFRSGISIGFYL